MDEGPVQVTEYNSSGVPRILAQGRLVRALDCVEAWLAAFLGTSLAVGMVSVPVCVLLLAAPDLVLLGWLLLAVLAAEGPFLWRLWRTVLVADFPIGPAMARRSRVRAKWLAWPIALWWTGHFVAGIIAIATVLALDNQRAWGEVAIVGSIMVLGFGVAGNIFLALAIKAISGSDQAVARMWHYRYAIDAIVALVATVIMPMA